MSAEPEDSLRGTSFSILSRLQSGLETVVRLDEALAAVAAARAEERAARNLDAERYRWLRERYQTLCRMEPALGLDLSRIYVNTAEKFDGVLDAAIRNLKPEGE